MTFVRLSSVDQRFASSAMQARAAFNQTQSGSRIAEEAGDKDLIAGLGAGAKHLAFRRTLADRQSSR